MTLTQIILGSGAVVTALASGIWFWLAARASHSEHEAQQAEENQPEASSKEHPQSQSAETGPLPQEHGKHHEQKKKHMMQFGKGNVADAAKYDVEHIFNTEFREELRNRGRLHFEKIINENAMFLQQDLRLTTSQLNDYMKQEIKRVLQEEFGKYEESITGANELAVSSIQKTQAAIEEQRNILKTQLVDEVAREKQLIIDRFQADMAEIVNHYILTAVGDELDLNDQVGFITRNLEANKQAILEDINHGS